jgi:hypothetical protein
LESILGLLRSLKIRALDQDQQKAGFPKNETIKSPSKRNKKTTRADPPLNGSLAFSSKASFSHK